MSDFPMTEGGTETEEQVAEKKNQALVKEYHERNERKKQDEAWLKTNKPYIEQTIMLGKAGKSQIGEYQVSVVYPDTSKIDPALVKELLKSHHLHFGTLKVTLLAEEVVELVKRIVEGVATGELSNDTTARVKGLLFSYGDWTIDEPAVEALLENEPELKEEVVNKCFVKSVGAPRTTIKKAGKE